MAPIPDDIPELGVKAGTVTGVIGETVPVRFAIAKLLDKEGKVPDMIDVELRPEPRVIRRWRTNGQPAGRRGRRLK